MALGRYHDTFNLFLGAIITGAMLGVEVETLATVAFSTGWLFSTLIMGPDIDITAKKRTLILRYFLLPYSFFFRHRGISHHFFWGTVSRNVYLLLILIILMTLTLYIAGHLDTDLSVVDTFKTYLPPMTFWHSPRGEKFLEFCIFALFGQWLSDLGHLFLDKIADKTGFFYK